MFKIKKLYLYLFTFFYMLISLLELVSYLKIDNTLYGVYYLIINLVLLFFFIPVVYNYKRTYSKARVSKIIIITILLIFNSFVLEHILLNTMNYMDSSKLYLENIFIYKNILKGILSFSLVVFLIYETNLNKTIKNKFKKVD